MRTDDLISVFDTATALAEFLGVTKSAISQWGETVPELRVFQIREKRPSIDAEIADMKERKPRRDEQPGRAA